MQASLFFSASLRPCMPPKVPLISTIALADDTQLLASARRAVFLPVLFSIFIFVARNVIRQKYCVVLFRNWMVYTCNDS